MKQGNLGRVDRINDFEYDLFLRPDVANPRFRFWFNFTLENVQRGQRILLNLVNLGRSCPLFFQGWTPVIRCSSKPNWKRLPTSQVLYYRCPRHRLRYVLSILLAFEMEEDVYQVALCYPYTYSRLLERLTFHEVLTSRFAEGTDYLDRKKAGPSVFGTATNLYFKRQSLGKSHQGRPLELLTISSTRSEYVTSQDEASGQIGEDYSKKKKIVIIMARIHPSETPSSFVCHGLIDFLISSHPLASALRNFSLFKIFPMIAVDGVFLGNTRTSLIGFDLNRVWVNANDLMHPVVWEAKKAFTETVHEYGDQVDVFMDIHSSTQCLGSFITGKKFEDIFRMEKHVLLPKLLSKTAQDFYLDKCVYQSEPLQSGTPRRALGSILPSKSDCYTLSVSSHGFYDTSSLGHRIVPYTEQRYAKLGERIAVALADCYVTTGHIPSEPQLDPFLTPKARSGKIHKNSENEISTHVLSLMNPFRKFKSPTSGRTTPKSLP